MCVPLWLLFLMDLLFLAGELENTLVGPAGKSPLLIWHQPSPLGPRYLVPSSAGGCGWWANQTRHHDTQISSFLSFLFVFFRFFFFFNEKRFRRKKKNQPQTDAGCVSSTYSTPHHVLSVCEAIAMIMRWKRKTTTTKGGRWPFGERDAPDWDDHQRRMCTRSPPPTPRKLFWS